MATKIFRPYSTHVNTLATLVGAATAHEACDPGDDLDHDDNTSYCAEGSGSLNEQLGFKIDPTFSESMAAITSVVFWVRLGEIVANGGSNNFTMTVGLGGSTSTSGTKVITAEDTYENHSYDVTDLRPGGDDWTEEDFRDSTFLFYWGNTAASSCAVRITSEWVVVTYIPSSAKVEASRRIASRMLRLRREPLRFRSVDVKERRFLHREIGDVIGASHFAIPHASRTGAESGVKDWQRTPHILMGVDLDLNNIIPKMKLLDGAGFWLGLWDVAKSDLNASSQRDGIAALDSGLDRTFLRDSPAWVEDPGDGRIVQILSHDEKNAADGMLIEKSATNNLLGSNFSEGYSTRWSAQGTGVNGSAVADDSTDLFWDTDETGYSCKITAGDPLGGTAVAIYQTSASFAANSVITASIRHKDDSGYGARILILRSTDGFYYSKATGWQVGYTSTLLTVRSAAERDQINNIDIGGSAATITIYIAAQENAGQVNHIYDVQIENSPFATSIIKTTSATVTRSDDELYFSDKVSARAIYPTRHSGYIRIIPLWSTADLQSGDKKTIFYIQYDANDELHFYYDEASGAFKYERTVGGVTAAASKTTTVTKGTEYELAFRATSGSGELNLSNYTLSVFVDGVKGTDDQSAAPTGHESQAAIIHIGRTAADTDMMDAAFSHLYTTPLVLTDEAIARLPHG
jgi:hypothetical protein